MGNIFTYNNLKHGLLRRNIINLPHERVVYCGKPIFISSMCYELIGRVVVYIRGGL